MKSKGGRGYTCNSGATRTRSFGYAHALKVASGGASGPLRPSVDQADCAHREPTPNGWNHARASAGVKALLALLAASLCGCAVPRIVEPVARGGATGLQTPARAIPVAPVPFRTLDRQTERAIEPPAPLEPLVVTTET